MKKFNIFQFMAIGGVIGAVFLCVYLFIQMYQERGNGFVSGVLYAFAIGFGGMSGAGLGTLAFLLYRLLGKK